MTEIGSTQFKTEGQPAFPVADTGNENPASSSEGKETDGDQTQSQDGEQNPADAEVGKKDGSEDAGFLDHPRWKQREDDWKGRFNDQEQRHTSELAKLREEFDGKLKGLAPKEDAAAADTIDEVPSWFGGDEKQWKEFQEWNSGLVAKAREEAVGEIKAKTDAEQKAISDATTYFNEQVLSLESDKELNPKGEKIDRNKLLKFVLDNDLVDSKGRWNYRAAYLAMRGAVPAQAKPSTTDRKNLAASTTSDKSAEAKQPDYTTSDDFQKEGGRPW